MRSIHPPARRSPRLLCLTPSILLPLQKEEALAVVIGKS